ncbi:GIY-YIG nuclease family protein [Streptomyces acidicola]|uniref:GIY-YIG nuclease family protein n=1 Tax=Streptomyces acidicola TaxID=2596892 RepID=UPI0037B713B7
MVDIHTARTALYRLYDAEGVLLYVGITNMPNVRFATHRSKPWWKQVLRKEIEWFDTRQPAAEAEVLAIRNEQPLYNVTNSPWRSPAAES